jgi:hypothetical protein
MSRLIALLIALAFAVTAGVSPVLAQPKEPAAKSDKAATPAKKEPLDINSASEDQLKALPGIGARRTPRRSWKAGPTSGRMSWCRRRWCRKLPTTRSRIRSSPSRTSQDSSCRTGRAEEGEGQPADGTALVSERSVMDQNQDGRGRRRPTTSVVAHVMRRGPLPRRHPPRSGGTPTPLWPAPTPGDTAAVVQQAVHQVARPLLGGVQALRQVAGFLQLGVHLRAVLLPVLPDLHPEASERIVGAATTSTRSASRSSRC